MKLLLTGSSGFIGRHLVKFLTKHNNIDELHSIVRKESQKKYKFDHLVDLQDRTELKRVVKSINPDIVIHFAGSAAGKPSEYPLIQFDENVKSTYNLLESVSSNSTFIFASSIVIYGDTLYRANENYPCKPKSFYASSKLACEGLVHTYTATKSIKPFILRLPAVVGANLTHGILKAHLDKIYSNEKIFKIIGNKFGGAKKPYLHVDDICRTIGFIISGCFDPGIYNLAPNNELTSYEVADLVRKTTGIYKSIEIEDKIWPTDNLLLQIDSSKILQNISLSYPTSKLAIIRGINDNISTR